MLDPAIARFAIGNTCGEISIKSCHSEEKHDRRVLSGPRVCILVFLFRNGNLYCRSATFPGARGRTIIPSIVTNVCDQQCKIVNGVTRYSIGSFVRRCCNPVLIIKSIRCSCIPLAMIKRSLERSSYLRTRSSFEWKNEERYIIVYILNLSR